MAKTQPEAACSPVSLRTRSTWERCGILYSQCWEDPHVARTALRVPPGGTVLAIGAAGDNVLALLLDEPHRVLAIDVNPAQAALTELKRAALQALSLDQIGPFLGAGENPHRLRQLDHLRPRMSASATRWWDEHPDLVKRGVIHTGRFERYLAWFRRCVLPLIPGRSAVDAMLSARSLGEQQEVYRRAWDSPLWRALVRACFGQRALAARARHPTMFEQSQIQDVGRHYLERARRAFTQIPMQTNSFLTYMLRGQYDRDERAPQYLQRDALPRLAQLADRLHVEVASLSDALAGLPDHSIDAFYLSDVFELFEPSAYEQTLGELARVGRPGARICYWNNLVDRQRPDTLAGLVASHPEDAERLHQQDRAFLYSRFVVESVRGSACCGRGQLR